MIRKEKESGKHKPCRTLGCKERRRYDESYTTCLGSVNGAPLSTLLKPEVYLACLHTTLPQDLVTHGQDSLWLRCHLAGKSGLMPLKGAWLLLAEGSLLKTVNN